MLLFPPRKMLFFLLLIFKGQGHVLLNFPITSLFWSFPLRCWIFKVLPEIGKFSVLLQLLCNFSFPTPVGFYWSSAICSFSCSSFPKLIFLVKSNIRVFLIALVFKWGTGLAYCIWFQNSLCLNISYPEASSFISVLNPLGSWKYCFIYIYNKSSNVIAFDMNRVKEFLSKSY